MYEKLIKRTIFVAKCPGCEESVQVDKNPPRERFCNTCKKWVKFEEVSWTGPETTR